MRIFIKFYFITLIFFTQRAMAEILLGIAKNQKNEIVYTEKHTIEIDENNLNRKIQVEYSDASKKIFATMNSDFSKNRFIPDTIFEDFRFKSKITMHLNEDKIIFEEFKNGISIRKKSIPYQNDMVASQGFDNFIRSNITKLQKSDLEFSFGVLDSFDFFKLKGYKNAKTTEKLTEYGIKASSWILNLFAEELRVVYDDVTLRLQSFKGRSNILDDTGKPHNVLITYEWKSN